MPDEDRTPDRPTRGVHATDLMAADGPDHFALQVIAGVDLAFGQAAVTVDDRKRCAEDITTAGRGLANN